jgi:hypothetical protein
MKVVLLLFTLSLRKHLRFDLNAGKMASLKIYDKFGPLNPGGSTMRGIRHGAQQPLAEDCKRSSRGYTDQFWVDGPQCLRLSQR